MNQTPQQRSQSFVLPSSIARLPDEALKASGYVYRNGYSSRAEFQSSFGFDALRYPSLFRQTTTDLIVASSQFISDCSAHFANVRGNYARLGL